MNNTQLYERRDIWTHKPTLRTIYHDFFQRISRQCRRGKILEVGGGTGNLKEFFRENLSCDIVSIDIVSFPSLDVIADAHELPFKSDSFANIVAIDVLHHLERPKFFFNEVQRVLQPKGRLILIEPALTPVSKIIYSIFHHEPIIMNANPIEDGPRETTRDSFEANSAIPTLIFNKYRAVFEKTYPALNVVKIYYFSLMAYPLSGGFQHWTLLPHWAVHTLLKFENKIYPFVGKYIGFRLFVVLEKMY